MEQKMIIGPDQKNSTEACCSWKDRMRYVGLQLVLAFILVTVGCGGIRNTLAPMEQSQQISMGEDQEEPLAGELNAKHLEELYAKSGIKDRDRSIEEELKKLSHQSGIDFPIQMNKQVRGYIVYFATERKGFTTRSLARSKRYLPMIKEVFREYGLPEDLAYLAMVESGFNPQACSPAGACGMWQFIKGTGLRYGLAINGSVDERRDPEKSTRAAAQYLLDLYKQFGSWYLAAASYNCGEGRVQKELRKSNYSNFWELSANKCIPGETRNYVPQMIAATIIARNPKKFGFGDVPYQPPLTPHNEPDIAVAEVVPPAPAIKPPARRSKPAKVLLASTPDPRPHTVPISKQKSTMHAKGPAKTANRKVCASDRKTSGEHVNHARSGPYVASLFGYPHSGPKKTEARKNKSISSARARSNEKHKNIKPSPALLAEKHRPKPTRLAQKKGGHKAKLSKSKTKAKSKTFLVSEVR
jgi:hypothetical protein